MSDKEYILQLQEQNALQVQQIKQLEAKVLFLLEQIQKLGVKTVRRAKDSHNSSLPPSSDIIPVVKNLRVPSIRKSGGQLGHAGHTLSIRELPDKIIDLKSLFCNNCGQSLTDELYVLKSKRQVVEIQPIYEEYRQYSCECPRCKHEQIADFPLGINAPIQYGSSVQSLIRDCFVYRSGESSIYSLQTFTKLILTGIFSTSFRGQYWQYFRAFGSKMRRCLPNHQSTTCVVTNNI